MKQAQSWRIKELQRRVVAVLSVAMLLTAGQIPGARPAGAAYPGLDGRMVFVLEDQATGGTSIWTANADGSDPLQLVAANGLLNFAPVWSPDGQKIAFVRDDGDEGSSNLDLYVMNPDGTDLIRLTDTPANENAPTWSPDGLELAFVQDDQIRIVDTDGTDNRLVTTVTGASTPAWSPDGRKLAFARSVNRGIYTINHDGSNRIRLTSGNHSDPQWSPDGRRLAFQSTNRDGDVRILVMNASGTNMGSVAAAEFPNSVFAPAWSPGGGRVAYTAYGFGLPRGVTDIYTATPSGTSVRLAIRGGMEPDWQPLPEFAPLVTVGAHRFVEGTRLLPLGTEVVWEFNGAKAHTVTSTVGLFDSGRKRDGSEFSYSFTAAGLYPYRSELNASKGLRGTISIPVEIPKRSGSVNDSFLVRWATAPPPEGYAFQVQVLTPKAASYSFLADMTKQDPAMAEGARFDLETTFTPDTGEGTYWFRARMINLKTGEATGYSAPQAIVVSG